MSHKSVREECLTRALRNSVKQGCPTRVSPQCVNSGCLTGGFAGKCENYVFVPQHTWASSCFPLQNKNEINETDFGGHTAITLESGTTNKSVFSCELRINFALTLGGLVCWFF